MPQANDCRCRHRLIFLRRHHLDKCENRLGMCDVRVSRSGYARLSTILKKRKFVFVCCLTFLSIARHLSLHFQFIIAVSL